MKFIFMKGVPGISSRVEKNLMIPSLRDFSVMHILEDCICEESGYPPKLVVYLDSVVMKGLYKTAVKIRKVRTCHRK